MSDSESDEVFALKEKIKDMDKTIILGVHFYSSMKSSYDLEKLKRDLVEKKLNKIPKWIRKLYIHE